MQMMRNLIVAFGLLVATACSSTSTMSSGMTREAFLQASPEQRTAELHRKQEAVRISQEWEIVTLRAGEPVSFEYDGTGYTIQCHRFPGSARTELAVYHGHSAPGWNRATHQSLATFLADADCVLVLRDMGGGVMVPIQNRNNSTAQADLGRAVLLGAVPGLTNGIGAIVTKEILGDDCGSGGCGTTFNVMGGSAGAVAQNSNKNTNLVDVETGVNLVNESCGRRSCLEYRTD